MQHDGKEGSAVPHPTTRVTALGLPTYLCQGRHDHTANHGLARACCDGLRAPAKGFYAFERSHSPAFEEPDRFRRILREDVLTGSTRPTDSNS